MEKLVYVGWKPDDAPIAEFGRRLRGEIAATLLAHDGVRALTMILADEHAVAGLRIAPRDPTAVISIWVDSALRRAALERTLGAVLPRLAGYVALESVPRVDPHHVVALGTRVPGLYNVAFLEKPDRLDYDTWLAHWQGEHTTTALETQRTLLYVQNVLVRAVTADAPPWTAIVEEAFPAAAANDPLQFYVADSVEQLAAQQRRMMASCERFIDFARFETLPMSAYVLRSLSG